MKTPLELIEVHINLFACSRVLLMEDGDQRESVVAKRKEILEFIGKEKRKRECAANRLLHLLPVGCEALQKLPHQV